MATSDETSAIVLGVVLGLTCWFLASYRLTSSPALQSGK